MRGISIEPSALGRILVPEDLPPGFALFWTTADYTGKLDADSIRKIEEILLAFGLDAVLSTCQQVHGSAVQRIEATRDRWCEYASCDGLWTDLSPASIGIKIADCLPLSLIDPVNRVIANVHVGWRGAVAGVVGRTLDALDGAERLSSLNARAYLGPAIRRCCFEVGEEVVSELSNTVEDIDRFVDRTRGPRPHVDLAGIAVAELQHWGIRHVFDTELCTRCDGSIFHSYRRDGEKAGRNLAIVGQ